MLHLASQTAADWFDRVADCLDLVLIDHAHLEKRAASTALSMIFRYTSRTDLTRELARVVREEMEHFELMLDVLEQRGIEFRQLDPAPYARELVGHVRKQEPETLLDKLLVAALIEARSCERFRILATRLPDDDLRTLYDGLATQEAHHHMLYTRLARTYFDPADVSARLDELARLEALAVEGSVGEPRLHSA